MPLKRRLGRQLRPLQRDHECVLLNVARLTLPRGWFAEAEYDDLFIARIKLRDRPTQYLRTPSVLRSLQPFFGCSVCMRSPRFASFPLNSTFSATPAPFTYSGKFTESPLVRQVYNPPLFPR